MANNPYQKYQNTQIETASQEQLTLMLYNGTIKFIKQAKQEVKNNNYQNVNNYLIRAQDIIQELMLTLDMEKGGELAQNLESLYDYMNRKLMEANVNKEVEPMDEVIDMMKELRNTWKKAMEKVKQSSSPSDSKVKSGGISIEG